MSWRRASTALLVLWAAAFWLSEGLLQAVADLSLLAALALVVTRRASLPPMARLPVLLAVALGAWEAISPLLARVFGFPGLPSSGRWLHCNDTAAPAAAALLGTQVARWAAVEVTFAAGGFATLALSVLQHQLRWSFPVPKFLRLPVDRVHETFGGEDRFAAGGFFFHRLRLAHASIAALGPAAGAMFWPLDRRRRWVGGLLALACVACIVLSYARAALLTAGLLLLLAALRTARGWARWAALSAILVAVAAALASPGWRVRLGEAGENFFGGERALARHAGWDLVHQHPWLGVGFGNYQQAALARQSVTGITEQLSHDAHLIPLTVWAETGVVGLGLYLALHLSLALSLLRRSRDGHWMAAGALISWGGFQILGMAHFLPFHPSVALAFAFVWGVGLVHPAVSACSGMTRRVSGNDVAAQPSAAR